MRLPFCFRSLLDAENFINCATDPMCFLIVLSLTRRPFCPSSWVGLMQKCKSLGQPDMTAKYLVSFLCGALIAWKDTLCLMVTIFLSTRCFKAMLVDVCWWCTMEKTYSPPHLQGSVLWLCIMERHPHFPMYSSLEMESHSFLLLVSQEQSRT